MAHIPDGLLSPPVIAGTAALSAVALALAARRSRHELQDRQAPLLGAATAFIFAAQMLNFPLGAGASAHLLGGVLIAAIVGPWAAMLALFSVVLVQALLFQDGGIAALGANTLNLAVIGAGGGYLVYRWQLGLTGVGHRRRLAAAGIAAFLSALAIGLAAGVELGLSGIVPLRTAVVAVGGAHIAIGLVEAGLTVGILAMVLRSRPDLVRRHRVTRGHRVATVVLTASVAVALAAGAWGSGLPDAFEAATARLGVAVHLGPAVPRLLNGTAPWLAAAVGLAAAFGVTWLLVRLAVRRVRPT